RRCSPSPGRAFGADSPGRGGPAGCRRARVRSGSFGPPLDLEDQVADRAPVGELFLAFEGDDLLLGYALVEAIAMRRHEPLVHALEMGQRPAEDLRGLVHLVQPMVRELLELPRARLLLLQLDPRVCEIVLAVVEIQPHRAERLRRDKLLAPPVDAADLCRFVRHLTPPPSRRIVSALHPSSPARARARP